MLAAVTSSTTPAAAPATNPRTFQVDSDALTDYLKQHGAQRDPRDDRERQPEQDRHRGLPEDRPGDGAAPGAERDQDGQQPPPVTQLLEHGDQQAGSDQEQGSPRPRWPARAGSARTAAACPACRKSIMARGCPATSGRTRLGRLDTRVTVQLDWEPEGLVKTLAGEGRHR
jgi:hypothetical protein